MPTTRPSVRCNARSHRTSMPESAPCAPFAMVAVALTLLSACEFGNLVLAPPPPEPPPEPAPTATCNFPSGTFQVSLALELMNVVREAQQLTRFGSKNDRLTPGNDLQEAPCWQVAAFINTADSRQAHTQVLVATNSRTKDVVIAFPGSGDLNDWLHDFTVLPSTWEQRRGCDYAPTTPIPNAVHAGFRHAYGFIRVQLQKELLSSLPTPAHRQTARVFITGHSLGGALATLASLDLVNCLVERGYPRNHVVMYALAGPRAILEHIYADFRYEMPNSYNIVNFQDPISHLPLSWRSDGYTHIPQMIVLESFPHTPDTLRNRRTRVDRVSGEDYGSCKWSLPRDGDYHQLWAYRERLLTIQGTSSIPEVEIGVVNGLFVIGYRRDEDQWVGSCDALALYQGTPVDPDNLIRSSVTPVSFPGGCVDVEELADCYPTERTRYDGYYVAYLDQFGRVRASREYEAPIPDLACRRTSPTQIEVEWSEAGDAGRFDYVALYDHNPKGKGDNHIAGKKHYVWTRPRDVPDGDRNFLGVLRQNYWAAYVMQDGDVRTSRSRILTSKRCH